jgi:hypothetical protein
MKGNAGHERTRLVYLAVVRLGKSLIVVWVLRVPMPFQARGTITPPWALIEGTIEVMRKERSKVSVPLLNAVVCFSAYRAKP